LGKDGKLALIPARGGSKRLPGKNIADFLGRPIIAHTIDAARESGLFDKVLVSTDDKDIAAIASGLGADIHHRSESLATDTATTGEVVLDVIEYERSLGNEYGILCLLYATAPLRTAEDIRGVVGLVEPGKHDFAMAVTEYWLPPHQALVPDQDGVLGPMWPEIINRKSQEFAALRVDNGSTYAVSVPAFLEQRTFYGTGLRGHDMPRLRSIDIDVQEDLDLARLVAENLLG